MTGENTEAPKEQTKKEESDITTERVKFLWDLFRPNSPCGKNAWIDLKKEKPYLFDEEKAATETVKKTIQNITKNYLENLAERGVLTESSQATPDSTQEMP